MTTARVLVRWLGGLDEAELAALLDRRPGVLLGPQPRDLTELAQRLQHPQSLALRSLALPFLQLVEAAQALGDGCTRASLAEFLDGDGPHHRVDVDRIVDELIAFAVVVPDGDRIALPNAFAEIFPSPLGLGPPLQVLLRDLPVDAMRRIQAALGLKKTQNRADTVAALVSHLGDLDNVRAILANAPAEVVEYLETVTGERPYDEPEVYDPVRYQQRRAATQWAVEHGLMFDAAYGYGGHVPAEVARVLRGPEYRAPFTPHPPEPTTGGVDRARLEADSAAAATEFAACARGA